MSLPHPVCCVCVLCVCVCVFTVKMNTAGSTRFVGALPGGVSAAGSSPPGSAHSSQSSGLHGPTHS